MTLKEATEVARRYYTTKQQKESPYKVGQKVRIIHLEGEDYRYDGKEGVISTSMASASCMAPGADSPLSPKPMSLL